MKIINPRNGEKIGTIEGTGPEEIQKKVELSVLAGKDWSQKKPSDRARLLLKMGEVVEANIGLIAETESLNCGRDTELILAHEIRHSVDVLQYFAGATRLLTSPSTNEYFMQRTSMVRRESYGVVAAVLPSNYPFLSFVWKVGVALAGGNSIVVKPHEWTPLSVNLAIQLFDPITPSGLVQAIYGGPRQGSNLVTSEAVDLVTVTGSSAVCLQVANLAQGKKVLSDASGKSVGIICPDANLKKAIPTMLQYVFSVAGQDCAAPVWWLAPSERKEEIKELVEQELANFDNLVPLIRGEADTVIESLNFDHYEVIRPQASIPQEGSYMLPTILWDTNPSDKVNELDLWAPIVSISFFEEEGDMILAANRSPGRIGCSVWTQSIDRLFQQSSQLNFGSIWVNSVPCVPAEMPHGGFGGCNFGKDQGMASLLEYTREKHILVKWD